MTALENQTVPLSSIIVVDNASTDGTNEWFDSSVFMSNLKFIYLKLDNNSGGAGGFNAGLQYAHKHSYDWSWIMDDDALPERNALEEFIIKKKNCPICNTEIEDFEITKPNMTVLKLCFMNYYNPDRKNYFSGTINA